MTYATTATNPAPTTAQVDVAFDNPHVQVAAERLAAKRQLLAEIAGIRSSILEAIDAGGTTDPITIVQERALTRRHRSRQFRRREIPCTRDEMRLNVGPLRGE